MARRRSGEQYLREYLGDGYNISKENEAKYAKAYYDKTEKASGEKQKLTDEYKRTRNHIKNGTRVKDKSAADQLRGVNAKSGTAAKKRAENQAVYGAKKTIERGRNILKSSTNDPGEKVMGAGSKVTPPVKKNSSKKRNAPKSKSAAKRSIRKK